MARAIGDDVAASGGRSVEHHDGPGVPARSSVAIVALVVVAAAVLRPLLERLFGQPAVAHWATIFVAITVQAMPFLVLGVAISAAVAAFVPAGFLPRALPHRPAVAVPVAALAGCALPGCECGSVPIAGRLVSRGAPPAAALAFLLSAPAINPVVMVSTAVAFPGEPEVVVARFLASLIAATVVGLIWARSGRDDLVERARRQPTPTGPPRSVFVGTAQHDLLHAGGFLIIGAATAATLQTIVPQRILETFAGRGVLAVATMAGLAVVMSICSEADAFVAASLTQFSLSSRLTFMVVGPMVDLKLISLQTGTFGRAFASRFAPLTLAVAIAASVVIGWLLL